MIEMSCVAIIEKPFYQIAIVMARSGQEEEK